MKNWDNIFESRIAELTAGEDPAHDLLHFKRVVATACALAKDENASLDVVLPAAWLHDFVLVAKNDPRRSQASRLSALAACEFLRSVDYPSEHLEAIAHAIEAHSFSAEIAPRTLEAKIVQDADRLDALGAIGLARCFAVAGQLKTSFYSADDPFCSSRKPDDKSFTIDHFHRKLLRIAATLQTEAGRAEGTRRLEVMKRFLSDLAREI